MPTRPAWPRFTLVVASLLSACEGSRSTIDPSEGDSIAAIGCTTEQDCDGLGLKCDTRRWVCASCLSDADCGPGQSCSLGACLPRVCEPESQFCLEGAAVECNQRGTGFVSRQPCPDQDCRIDGDASYCAGEPSCRRGRSVLCQALPEFSGEQVVDGSDQDFCVPAMTYALSDAAWTNPEPAPLGSPVIVTARVGWSEQALHAQVYVFDPSVSVDPDDGRLWNGDNVQIFFAGTDELTGAYDGQVDGGATHVIVSPPESEDGSARAVVLYEDASGTVSSPLDDGDYAARLTEDGYEVELRLPFADGLEPPKAGSRLGFDLVLGDATDGVLLLEGAIANQPVVDTSCANGISRPGCDDRSWCLTTLE